MSSDLLVDLNDDLGVDDPPSNALDQLKLSPMGDKLWPPDDSSMSKSGKNLKAIRRTAGPLCAVRCGQLGDNVKNELADI